MNNERLDYFFDYWKDITTSNSIEAVFVHSIVYNPKELFKEFADEIRRNGLSNPDNKALFIDKINEFSKLNLKALDFIKPCLTLIKQQFSKKNNYDYLLHLLHILNHQLGGWRLGLEAVKELAECIFDSNSFDKIRIGHLINLVIFELTHKKYSKQTISKIVENIFDSCQNLGEALITNFPHSIKRTDWQQGEEGYQSYKNEVARFISQLTEKDRVLAISNYLAKESEERIYIFPITGLRVSGAIKHIGRVQLYNPQDHKLITEIDSDLKEVFRKSGQLVYGNAAITVNTVDGDYSKQEAIQGIGMVLDMLMAKYSRYPIPVKIDTTMYLITDADGNNRGGGWSANSEFIQGQDSLSLAEIDSLPYVHFTDNEVSVIDKKILESMHWKRRAIESNDMHEKLLWFWVALENILEGRDARTAENIFNIASICMTIRSIHFQCQIHYQKIIDMLGTKGNLKHYRRQLDFPAELASALTGRIKLQAFLGKIPEICSHLSSDSLLYDQLTRLHANFSNNANAARMLNSLKVIFKEKLIYVYRLRNKIVHNAYSENNPSDLDYLNFINEVSTIVLMDFNDAKNKFQLNDADSVMNNIDYQFDELLYNLENIGVSVLFEK